MKIEHRIPPMNDGAAFKAAFIPYLDQATAETAQAMRRRLAANRTAAFSTLLNSVKTYAESELRRLVAPGVNYARMVEEGTGPAGGKARYFPNPKALEPWIKLRARITYTRRAGSRKRRQQEDEVRDRAWGLARFIAAHGTRAQPFVAPTAVEMRPRIVQLLKQGVGAGAMAQMGAK